MYSWLRFILVAYPSLNCSLLVQKSMINIKSKLIDCKGFQLEFDDFNLKNEGIDQSINLKYVQNEIPSLFNCIIFLI